MIDDIVMKDVRPTAIFGPFKDLDDITEILVDYVLALASVDLNANK